MAYCTECGTEIRDGVTVCDDCESELSSDGAPSQGVKSFLDRYEAEPLPFAEGRGELIHLNGTLLGHLPVIGWFGKFTIGVTFWCYSIWLTVFRVLTGGADVVDRFAADKEYIKDNFYSGYHGEGRPPSPPK